MIIPLPKKILNFYFHGKRKSNKISITFDDGPSKETEKILEILKKNKAKATFFIFGERIKGREEIIQKIINEGHEIGNHSFSHKKMSFKTKKFIEEDLKKTDKELEILNIRTNLFRPPYLRIGFNLIRVCRKLNKKIILCDVASDDWKKQNIEKIIVKVITKTKKGSIINFHDYLEGIGSNEEIINILKQILPNLKNKYELVTISELLKK